jgi:predicted dienelactone hydrolase
MRRLLIPLVLVLAAACASQDDVSDVPKLKTSEHGRYGEEAGPSPVGSIPDISLRDEARNRDLRLTIDYPVNATGAQPLILISPATGGTNRGYVGLSAYWASFGYVVVRADHGEREMSDRLHDLTFVLDSLDRLERDYPELQGKMDRTRIGVAGHGAGAVAAMLLAGVRTSPGGAALADPRVKAIVALSPPGPGRFGLTNESFAMLRGPALFMTGTRDTGETDTETPAWRRQAFELAPAGDKWLVSLEGVSGGSFSGRLSAPPNVQQRQDEIDPFSGRRIEQPRSARGEGVFLRERTAFHLIRSLSLGFWDAYLRGEASGSEYLNRADQRDDTEVVKK